MGPALLELYATSPSVKRQMSEKRDSSPQLFNQSTGRPMTRTLSMKAELIKDTTEGEKKLAGSRSVESNFSLGGYSIKGGFMSRSSGVSSLTSSPSSSSSSLLLPKSKTLTTTSNSLLSSTTTTTASASVKSSSSSSSLAKYFRLKFIGSAVLDKRYTLPMIPWIIHEIRRNSIHRGSKDIELEVNDICLKAVVKGERVPLFVHSHQFVSKFSPDPTDKASFTYLYRDHPDSQYTIYLFQSTSESMVLDLVNAMREATKAINFHNGSNLIQRSGTSNLDNILSNSQQFEVMYVGKIKVYQKRAPPSFIDDAVENFRTSEPSKVKFSDKEADESIQQRPPSDRSDSEASVTPTPFNYSKSESGSLSTTNSPTTTPTIINQLGMQRPRSISSLTTCKEYKETLDEESPKEEIVVVTVSPKSDSMTTSISHPVTITCTSHADEKDSVFSDEGRESMDDCSLNFSRPGSSASTTSGGGCTFGSTGGSSLHLPSSSLITNTQSLDEQGRASIMRDLAVCSKHNQDSLSPIPSPNPSEVDSPVEGDKKLESSPIKIEIIDVRSEMKVIPPTSSSPQPPVSSSSSPAPSTTLASLSPEKISTPTSPSSDNIPVRKLSTEKQVSLPYRTRTNSGGNSDLRRNRQSTKFQNRTMLFLIGRLEICLISPDLHQILFNKTFNYVSHCSQGVKYMDHFGFICREPSFYPSETYVGYVFRCQTDKLVNEIMHTLKQAFHNAHHAYQVNKNKSTIICETCPMQWFHRLCLDVETLPAEKAQTIILQRLDSLPDTDKNEVMSMYEGSQVSSIEEQNEIIMMLLRGMSERKQKKHNHHGKDDKRNSISTLDNLKQKARKSLSNSFETILKRAGSPSIANYYNQSSAINVRLNRSHHSLHETRTRASTISGFTHLPKLAQGDSTDDLSSSSNPSPKHRSDHSFFEVTSSRPRSSTIGDVKDLQENGGRSGSSDGPVTSGSGVFGSGSGSSSGFGSGGGSITEGTSRLGPRSESIPLNGLGSSNKSPLYNIFMKIGSNSKSSAGSSFDSASETGGGRRGLGSDGYNGSSIGSEGQSSGFSVWSGSSGFSGGNNCKPSLKEQRGWRKTIFSNIKTTTTAKILDKYDSQDSCRYSLDSSSDNSSFNSSISTSDANSTSIDGSVGLIVSQSPKKSSAELRNLWKKAINQQITLIQMEKENKRLQANQSVVTCKRMKLDYEEITPCLKETSKMWDELLKRDPSDTSLDYLLKDSIKKGVPRSKRGEIWQFIARYNKQNNRLLMGCKDVGTIDPDKPYRQLLQQLTAQQHAILVDLGRTFPKHPYFAQPLGAGQLSLFNLLKAYSLFDIEVGYCQGLSFVAAILLLHMNEDESFEMMKYLLFHLGLRRQYKPDMSALQMQLYQLTRLLYDFHHDIYQHFDTHDIPPTLYAAPWFLTLFASQFPIGFVARLFDIIFLHGIETIFRLSIVLLATYREAILSCSSFETIMELLKTEIPQMDAIQMERVFNQVLSRDISKQLIVYETEYNLLQEEVSSLSTSFGSTSGANCELFGSTSNITHHPPPLTHHQISLPPSLSPIKGQQQQLKSTLSFSTVATQYIDENKLTNSFVDCSTSTVNSPVKESNGNSDDSLRLTEIEGENKLLKSQNMELLDQLHVAQSNVYSLESSIETLKSTIKRLESRVRSVEEERDVLFDSLNMLRQRTTSSANQSGSNSIPSSTGGTPLAVSPLPESNQE